MYADTADALRILIDRHPDETPSVFIRDDVFAAWCYDRYTLADLRSALQRDADPEQCKKWGLTADQWREHVEMALVARASLENQPEQVKVLPPGKMPLWYKPKG